MHTVIIFCLSRKKKCSMDIETIYDEEQILNVFASMVKDGFIYLGA